MRASGNLAARVLQYAGTLVKPGRPDSDSSTAHSVSYASTVISADNTPLYKGQQQRDAAPAAATSSGVTTDEIDKAVHKMIIENNAYPSPLNYGG